MARRRAPLFLKRQSYRQRRLRDAARLLPLLGGFLVLLPILWSTRGAETAPSGAGTAFDGVYLFAVWVGLVAGAALLAQGLARDGDPDDGVDHGEGVTGVATGAATGAATAAATADGAVRGES